MFLRGITSLRLQRNYCRRYSKFVASVEEMVENIKLGNARYVSKAITLGMSYPLIILPFLEC